MKKVLELQFSLWGGCKLQNLSHIVYSSFLIWKVYKQGDVVIQFHMKKFVHMGWAHQKGQPKKIKNKNYSHF